MTGNVRQSPRIIALRDAIERGDSTALDAFWRRIEADGTPLIESIEGEEDHALATFLWRDSVAGNVILMSPFRGADPEDGALMRLHGTDLWYWTETVRRDARFTYSFSPDDPLIPITEVRDIRGMLRRWRPDPLNPRTFVHARSDDDPTSYGLTRSILEMPNAAPQPHAAPRADVPAGVVDRHWFRSAILNNDRVVWVYTPPGYDSEASTPYGLLVLFDGGVYLHTVRTDAILDNLLAESLIPPLVCVLINNVTIDSRSGELPCNERFFDFVVTELLPWVAERYHITQDPTRTVAAGSSLGGLASMYAGYRHPERFGKILCQSGSFRWCPGPAGGDEEPGWIIRRFVESPRLPLDIYMDVGNLDRLQRKPDDPTLLDLNRHLRDVLRAKEYPLCYVEFSGGHDYAWWRGTLADGLIYLLGVASIPCP